MKIQFPNMLTNDFSKYYTISCLQAIDLNMIYSYPKDYIMTEDIYFYENVAQQL
jgi:hypothetical protein